MDQPTPAPDYGASFADVYDEWYGHITDTDGTVARVVDLASESGHRRVLELGVGSGRLALPLAERGLEVVGIDSSPAMLRRLAAKPGAATVEVHEGDMATADEIVDGPFGVVLIAFNTLFNLSDETAQQRCLDACARLLHPRGSLLVETAVWGDPADRVERGLSTTRVELDRVVLSATEHDPRAQVVIGQHIDITDAGTRLRPWRIRYLTTSQLDTLAAAAGLVLAARWSDWDRSSFGDDDTHQVACYHRA